jgi:hypothetical protein
MAIRMATAIGKATVIKRILWFSAVLTALLLASLIWSPAAGAGIPGTSLKVLPPLESGNLTVYPVVTGAPHDTSGFITLDEGLRSGEVVVTEAGSIRGLVRDGRRPRPISGDQVNTLVLLNKSDRPLILLAGEIVTGGKQDRIIAKDRIVPPHGDPVDLSVFCVEPGRWTARSTNFASGAAGNNYSAGMVAPRVRAGAMAANDQQEVWNQVRDSNKKMAAAAPPEARAELESTTSYAVVMAAPSVQKSVDRMAAPIERDLMKQLHERNAVGVVVAVNGEIIWADVFASPALLEKYWPKLIRSYAAEAFETRGSGGKSDVSAAQRFLDEMQGTHESVESEPGVFRQTEISGAGFRAFELTSLLPKTGFDVHVAKVAQKLVAMVTPNVRPLTMVTPTVGPMRPLEKPQLVCESGCRD